MGTGGVGAASKEQSSSANSNNPKFAAPSQLQTVALNAAKGVKNRWASRDITNNLSKIRHGEQQQHKKRTKDTVRIHEEKSERGKVLVYARYGVIKTHS